MIAQHRPKAVMLFAEDNESDSDVGDLYLDIREQGKIVDLVQTMKQRTRTVLNKDIFGSPMTKGMTTIVIDGPEPHSKPDQAFSGLG